MSITTNETSMLNQLGTDGTVLALAWALAFIYATTRLLRALGTALGGGCVGDADSPAAKRLGMALALVFGLAALPPVWVVLID